MFSLLVRYIVVLSEVNSSWLERTGDRNWTWSQRFNELFRTFIFIVDVNDYQTFQYTCKVKSHLRRRHHFIQSCMYTKSCKWWQNFYSAKPMFCLACYVQVMAFHCLRRRLPMTKICLLDLIISDGKYSSSRICMHIHKEISVQTQLSKKVLYLQFFYNVPISAPLAIWDRLLTWSFWSLFENEYLQSLDFHCSDLLYHFTNVNYSVPIFVS